MGLPPTNDTNKILNSQISSTNRLGKKISQGQLKVLMNQQDSLLTNDELNAQDGNLNRKGIANMMSSHQNLPRGSVLGASNMGSSQFESSARNLMLNKAGAQVTGNQMQIKTACSLRSHMDGVRGLQFLPNSDTLVSASEDCTIQLWDLSVLQDQNIGNVQEIEPYLTLRGHTCPIISIGAAKTVLPDMS